MDKFLELWEQFDVYCYGSGEEAILESLKTMFGTFKYRYEKYSYDYKECIKALGNESLFWSLLILMEHASFIDWGTSIRLGWTEEDGTEFVNYILGNSVEDIYELIMK